MNWTAEEEAYLSKHYPFVDSAQLGRIFKRPTTAVVSHANVMGLHKHHVSHDLHREVLRLAARPQGMRAAELGGSEFARRFCCVMVNRGELWKVVVSFKVVRYFATHALAAAFGRANAKPPTVTLKRRRERAWWPADTQPYYPPGLQTIQCPSPQLGLHTSWGCGISSWL